MGPLVVRMAGDLTGGGVLTCRNVRSARSFHDIVRPTAAESLSIVGDVRRGFLAAVVLYHMYHMADYWALENNSTKQLLKALCGR